MDVDPPSLRLLLKTNKIRGILPFFYLSNINL